MTHQNLYRYRITVYKSRHEVEHNAQAALGDSADAQVLRDEMNSGSTPGGNPWDLHYVVYEARVDGMTPALELGYQLYNLNLPTDDTEGHKLPAGVTEVHWGTQVREEDASYERVLIEQVE